MSELLVPNQRTELDSSPASLKRKREKILEEIENDINKLVLAANLDPIIRVATSALNIAVKHIMQVYKKEVRALEMQLKREMEKCYGSSKGNENPSRSLLFGGGSSGGGGSGGSFGGESSGNINGNKSVRRISKPCERNVKNTRNKLNEKNELLRKSEFVSGVVQDFTMTGALRKELASFMVDALEAIRNLDEEKAKYYKEHDGEFQTVIKENLKKRIDFVAEKRANP